MNLLDQDKLFIKLPHSVFIFTLTIYVLDICTSFVLSCENAIYQDEVKCQSNES